MQGEDSAKLPTAISASDAARIGVDEAAQARVATVQGLVAILDALGTKLLSLAEAIEFVSLRDKIMESTARVIETGLPGLDKSRLKTFTFNDTLIYTYEPPGGLTLAEVERFCHVLRVAETLSITMKHPFRGAFAVGEFFVGDERTVLGPAVSDAASWFEAADWIGVHATPHATMFIQSLLERSPAAKLEHVLVDYDVPVTKDKSKRRLKAVNWPKGFFISGLRPSGNGTTRGLVLSSLAQRRVPKDTESKYFNAIEFFDAVEGMQNLEKRFTGTVIAELSAPPSAST
jgi:hypothetical protein